MPLVNRRADPALIAHVDIVPKVIGLRGVANTTRHAGTA
jgi:hypothetical protein